MTNPYVAQPTIPPASTGDGKLIARKVLAILGALGSVITGVVFAIIWVVGVHLTGWGLGVVIPAVLVAMIVPVVLFAVLSSWMFAPSSEGRIYLSRWIWITLGIESLSIAGMIVMGFVSQPQIWLPITLVILAAVFTAVAILLGRALRSTPPAPVPLVLGLWSPPNAGIWFWWVVAAIVILPAGLLLPALRPWELTAGDGSTFEGAIYFILVGLAFVAAGFTCTIRSLVVANRMPKNAASKDFALRRKISRATYRSKSESLTADELEYARRNAVLVQAIIPWQLGYLVLFITGISLNQIPSIRTGFGAGLWFILAFAVIVVVSIVVFVRYIALAARFLKVNGQPTPVAAQPAHYPAPYQMQPPPTP